ncbi:MAG TPA: CYTH and CHAD domain-containing protein [Acidimicrobiales bacterium]|nr:CYTH and CHAD domain-containing protein [Acidimicrobiales bacterium]
MEASSRSLERELKFSAEPALALPDLRGLVDTTRLPELSLRAAYFDTADLRLWRQGITLRHRVGEGPETGLWTLKLPNDVDREALARTEVSWPGARGSVPAEVTALVRGVVRHTELRQLFELCTTRERMDLHDRVGNRIGELDDDLVTIVGGPNDGLRFRQLELELAEGADGSEGAATVRAVAEALASAGAGPGDGAKFAKALGPDAAECKAGSRKLSKRSRMADVVRASVETGLGRLLAHDYLLRLEAADPRAEDVHQARVAARRLRSDLKTLRGVLDPVWNDHTRDDLRWLGCLLGEVRDLDVLRQRFGSARADVTEVGRREIDAVISEQRSLAIVSLQAGFDSERYVRLLDRLDGAVASPPLWATAARGDAVGPGQRARQALRPVVAVPWRTLRKRVRKAAGQPTDAQLHKIRIGAKQLRYASELAVPVEGKPARRTARRAEHLQTVLGDHHDAVFAEAWLRRESSNLPPAAVLEAGRLIETQRQVQAEMRRRWRHEWRALAKKKGLRWLRA